MSNKRVRQEIEAKELAEKAKAISATKYANYAKKETLILNYQMCKAYFHDQSASILTIVGMILKEKYNLPWQQKFINRALQAARSKGESNPTISIPQFKYEEKEHDILSKFVKKNFDKMIADQKRNGAYPFEFRDMVEKNS